MPRRPTPRWPSRRSPGRRAPTSPSSAAASPACRRRCIWPRPASTWRWSRPTASAGARRGGMAASSTPASGATRTGWRIASAWTPRAACGRSPKRPRRSPSASSTRHGIACDWRPGLIETVHQERLVADEIAYVDKLRDDYGYDAGRLARPRGARRGDRHRRLFRRTARRRRRPSRPAEVCARAGARRERRPAPASSRGRGQRRSSGDATTGFRIACATGHAPAGQAETATTLSAGIVILAGNGYLAGIDAAGRGAGDADRQLHRRHRADRRRPARRPDSRRRGGLGHALRRLLLPPERRRPAGLRRRRDLRQPRPRRHRAAGARPSRAHLSGSSPGRRSTMPGAARWRSP